MGGGVMPIFTLTLCLPVAEVTSFALSSAPTRRPSEAAPTSGSRQIQRSPRLSTTAGFGFHCCLSVLSLTSFHSTFRARHHLLPFVPRLRTSAEPGPSEAARWQMDGRQHLRLGCCALLPRRLPKLCWSVCLSVDPWCLRRCVFCVSVFPCVHRLTDRPLHPGCRQYHGGFPHPRLVTCLLRSLLSPSFSDPLSFRRFGFLATR